MKYFGMGMSYLNQAIALPRILRAILANQMARHAPQLYFKYTHETGRGPSAQWDSPEDVASYLQQCFFEYFGKLDIARAEIPKWLAGKVVLEYGPGDILGVALLMKGFGAQKVFCVDRFPLASVSEFNAKVLRIILEGLDPEMRSRADQCFIRAGEPESGFRSTHVEYLVNQQGLSQCDGNIDLIVSRAVLEHVNNLHASMMDMHAALRSGGLAVHLVDLRSHGMHRINVLDFLNWSPTLWHLMHSNKGVPNRIRVGRYRQIVNEVGFQLLALDPSIQTDLVVVHDARAQLAAPFRELDDEELRCLAFWMTLKKSSSGDPTQ